jgi:hypothetical protein
LLACRGARARRPAAAAARRGGGRTFEYEI